MTAGRLLFVVHDAPFFISHRLSLAEAAVARGYDVHVAAPADPEAEERIRATGADFHPIPLNRSSRNPLNEAKLVRFLWQLVGQLTPSLMHCVGMKPVLYAGAVARVKRVPGVVHAITGLGFMFLRQDLKIKVARQLIKLLYGFALGYKNARAIFQNPDDLALFQQSGLVDPAAVDMIRGCGVDMTTFRPRAKGIFVSDAPVVMFPARLIRDKGLGEFIEAVRLLRDDFPHVRFVLVGRTDAVNPTAYQEADIQAWIKEGLVEWWGFSEDMSETLRQADLVVLPSYREGLPRGLIEAAATGLPVIATDVPGCREVVRPGKTGFLVPAYDGAAIARVMRQILSDLTTARLYGMAARKMAEEEFSVETFVTQSFATYHRVEAAS